MDWDLTGAGYQAIKDAVGGRLKLDARADVGIKVGLWEEMVWVLGRGIGAGVSL